MLVFPGRVWQMVAWPGWRSDRLYREIFRRLSHQDLSLNPPPGVRTEAIEAGLDARKACVLRSGA